MTTRAAAAASDPAASDPVTAAREICLGLLERQPRTRTQLADALRRRGVTQDVAEQVLDRLGEVGLVDDAAFAAAWVSSRHAGRGLASSALRRELRGCGVDAELVEQAVSGLGPEDELATARAFVARRLASTAGLAENVRVRRLVGQLARRGYPSGLALRVVQDAIGAVEG